MDFCKIKVEFSQPFFVAIISLTQNLLFDFWVCYNSSVKRKWGTICILRRKI